MSYTLAKLVAAHSVIRLTDLPNDGKIESIKLVITIINMYFLFIQGI